MSQQQLYLNECITVVGSHTTCQFQSLKIRQSYCITAPYHMYHLTIRPVYYTVKTNAMTGTRNATVFMYEMSF